MRKRVRENPCGVCGHYHKYEEGEVCGVCGHRIPAGTERSTPQTSAFPSEILPEFLYLGSYDNASRAELLKTQGISHILNTVPSCQNLYKNSFTYHCLKEKGILQFDDAIQFIEQCEREKARVLVHCMSGRSRSPAVVMAYLMKGKGWRLPQSYQWVKDRRLSVELSADVYQQLQEFEHTLFAPYSNGSDVLAPLVEPPSLKFGFPSSGVNLSVPLFGQLPSTSIFDRGNASNVGFTFGGRTNDPLTVLPPNGTDTPMDSS